MRARSFTSDSLRSKLQRKLVHFVLHRWDLTDGGERVTPARPNDCYVAHLSIYDFATRFTRGKTILDAGCGAGYGTNYLLEKGLGARVQGVDISSNAIRYCRRHYRNARLSFKTGNLLDLEFGDTKFDLIRIECTGTRAECRQCAASPYFHALRKWNNAHSRAASSYQRPAIG
jgi:2-polyprenyl-3-methyl-5-hydroxy-6-metoxy-1,4-benzoquinol methylase